jgi:hypothetical protein
VAAKKQIRISERLAFTDEGFLSEALDKVSKDIRDEAQRGLAEIAENLRNDIVLRTTSGRSVRGEFFVNYSTYYARITKGRFQPVDLVLEGDLMNAVSQELFEATDDGTSYRVFVQDDMEWLGKEHQFGRMRGTKGVGDKPEGWKNKNAYRAKEHRHSGTGQNWLPARPWFGASDAGLQRYAERFEGQILDVAQDITRDASFEVIVELSF